MKSHALTADDRQLIELARATLRRAHREGRVSVAAALETRSGRVYRGVSVEGTPHGPCAEWVAIGAAFAEGDWDLRKIVAVAKDGRRYPVIPPCGSCRQILIDHAPDALVITANGGKLGKAKASELLPRPYRGR